MNVKRSSKPYKSPGGKGTRTVVEAWLGSLVEICNGKGNEAVQAGLARFLLKVLVVRIARDGGLIANDVAGEILRRIRDGDPRATLDCISDAASCLDGFLERLGTRFSNYPVETHPSKAFKFTFSRDAVQIESIITSMFDPALAFHPNDIDWFYERHVIPEKLRNSRGIVYTPNPIVNYIVERTVAKPLRTLNEQVQDTLTNGKELDAAKQVEHLVSFSVMDPACGTGRFLVKALQDILFALSDARHVIKKIKKIDIKFDVLASWNEVDVLVNALSSQIRGIDEDPDAVALANFHLIMAGWEWLSPYRAMLHPDQNDTVKARVVNACNGSIIWGNALVSPGPKDGFDAIIGNPPYVNYKKYLIKLDRKFLERRFRVFNGQADLSYYFFEVHHDWLAAGGTSSQITSRYFMEGSHATKLRELLEKQEIVEIIDLNDVEVFPDLGIHPAIITWRKKAPEPSHEIDVAHPFSMLEINDTTRRKVVLQSSISTRDATHGWTLLSSEEMAIKRKFDDCPSLGSLGTCISGSETGLDEAFVHHVLVEGKGEGPVGIVDGRRIPLEPMLVHEWVKNGDIDRWWFKASRYCIYVPPEMTGDELARDYPGVHGFLSRFKGRLESRDNGRIAVPWYVWRRPRNVKNLDVPAKIIMPYKAKSMRATIDTGRHYCSYDVTIFVPSDSCPDIRYIAAVLNSRAAWWYFSTFGKRMGAIFELYPGPVSNIRIPLAPRDVQAHVCTLVDKAVALSYMIHGDEKGTLENAMITLVSLNEEIDAMVDGLFALTKEDLKVMNPLLKQQRS